MPFGNTAQNYGSVTRFFHWLMFLMIVTIIPVGLIAVDLARDIRDPAIASTAQDFTRVFTLFTLHKTLGVAIFFTALARITWAISQPGPGLLNADKPFESFAAQTVHWLLYGSLLLVPLSGWLSHAATTGFAPIAWPFGQSLPFVPKDPALARMFAGLHLVLERVMVLSIFLHVAGALKHHFVDRDTTLRRMLTGTSNPPVPPPQKRSIWPVLAALALWGLALVIGQSIGAIPP